jgi:hypothetical protein
VPSGHGILIIIALSLIDAFGFSLDYPDPMAECKLDPLDLHQKVKGLVENAEKKGPP